MFFSGDYKKQRKINLSGKSVQLTREQLLQQAAQERQKREESEKQNQAALSIQRVYRSYSSRKQSSSDYMNNLNLNNTYQSPAEIHQCLSTMVFFYRTHVDFNYLLKLLGGLNQSSVWFDLKFDDNLQNLIWIKNISKLIQIALYECSNSQSDVIVNFFKQFIEKFKFKNQVYLHLYDKSVFKIIRKSYSEYYSDVLVSLANDIALNLPQSTPQYFHQILTIPSLYLSTYPSDRAFQYLSSDLFQNISLGADNHQLIDHLNVIANLSSLQSQSISQSISHHSNLMLSIQQVPKLFQENATMLGNSLNLTYDQTCAQTVQDNNHLRQKLSLLHDQNFINTMLFQGTQSTHHMQLITKLLCIIFEVDELSRNLVSTAIIYSNQQTYFKQLFCMLTSSELYEASLKGILKQQLLFMPSSKIDLIIIKVFADMFGRFLLTFGFEEFYDERNIFGIQNLVQYSKSMRNLVFYIVSNQNESLMQIQQIDLNGLKKSLFQILQQLNYRDVQRQYCDEDHWSITDQFDLIFFKDTIIEQESNYNDQSNFKLSPYQVILDNIPFVIPFLDRVELFRKLIEKSQKNYFSFGPAYKAVIRRNYLLEDSFNKLNDLGKNLRSKIGITFISELGLEEAGIDGGGVTKEFITSLCKKAFDVNFGLFSHTKDQLIYPNPQDYAKEPLQLQYFEFLGRMIGKALYEGILVEASFAGFFLNKWIGKLSYLDDLPSLDPELYKNLIFLKNYDGNIEDLSLTFSISSDEFGTAKTVELIPGGQSIPVTNQNKIRYIYLMAHYKMNLQIQQQCSAFFKGLSDLIEPRWLKIFNQKELHTLISGAHIPIDIQDLKSNTVYDNVYNEQHPTIKIFWNVLNQFDEQQKQEFVKFVTSCPRPPLLGFKELSPKFCIRHAGEDQERLPTTSTCVNLLKLPAYNSEKQVRDKLLYAIRSGAGFELS